jgi:putative flippase GtrA
MRRTKEGQAVVTQLDDASTGELTPVPGVGAGATALTWQARVFQIGRFGMVGVLGTLVNLLILHMLHTELGWGFTRSSMIATELAIVHNYIWNELWTFHLRQLDLRRLVQYNVSSLLGAGVTVVVATVVKELVDPRLAQLVGIMCGAGLNYLVNVRWTWGPGATPDDPAEQ